MHDHRGMPSHLRITVSEVSHGRRELVASLLRQLAELSDANVGRVVVTHNLPDDDLDKPAWAGYELVQLHNAKPLSFSANHSCAFARCKTPYFAVLNPDIEFLFGNPFPSFPETMVADSRLGIVAPIPVQSVTLRIEPNRRVVMPLVLVSRCLPSCKPPAETDGLVGALLLIWSYVYKALRGFDEGFRPYCEAMYLRVRFGCNAWLIRRMDSAHAVHAAQRSRCQSTRRMIWNRSGFLSLRFKWVWLANTDGLGATP
jgi:hypothetical protein